MTESTAIQCTNCNYSEIFVSPKTQEGLVNSIIELKERHPCEKMNLLQITWVDENGAFGHCLS